MLEANFEVPTFKTIAETSEFIGLSQYFVRKLIINQKIKYIKSGSKYLINIQSLIQFLQNGEEV